MDLNKLLEIKDETDRFYKRLQEAITLASSKTKYWNGETIPESGKNCTGTKQSSAVKRAALDLKRTLANL